jgi:hypothetical protein
MDERPEFVRLEMSPTIERRSILEKSLSQCLRLNLPAQQSNQELSLRRFERLEIIQFPRQPRMKIPASPSKPITSLHTSGLFLFLSGDVICSLCVSHAMTKEKVVKRVTLENDGEVKI